MPRVIVIGGGLSGLSAAHTVVQGGADCSLIEMNAFMGGNSTKATSGINGAGTRTQAAMNIPDTVALFEEDTVRSATGKTTGPCPPSFPLAKVLTHNSTDAVHWIQDNFGLALDVVSRLGGHSRPRTHRSKSGRKFPGMEITYALMQRYEQLSEQGKCRLLTKCRVKRLLTEHGRVVGVEYEDGQGEMKEEMGDAVVIATGGYGAGGLFPDSLLQKIRPDLCHLPTTNGEHCRGDGIMLAQAIGAQAVGLHHVQVHPTGLVNPDLPDNRTLFLAAEALRGEGGIIIDKHGNRFCNDIGKRDYVTGRMWEHNQGPYRLVLNSKASAAIGWHCKHYCGRRVMKHFSCGSDLAWEMAIPVEQLQKSFDQYNAHANYGTDPFGKKYFSGTPFEMEEGYYVAVVTPVVHYTMGGLAIGPGAECVNKKTSRSIPGLYAAGEVTGGVHGHNRLGGSALLECVVFGRVAGNSAMQFIHSPSASAAGASTVTITVPQPSGVPITIAIYGLDVSINAPSPPRQEGKLIEVNPWEDAASTQVGKDTSGHGSHAEAKAKALLEETAHYTLEEVGKHKTDKDCWLVVNGDVLNATKFLPDHPGGKMAILAFAGRDATEEFNMVHDEGVVQKYAPNTIIGKLKPCGKL